MSRWCILFAMKLVDLTCPHCGAHLEVDEGLTRATCRYCGAGLLIDRKTLDVRIVNAEEAGRDFERGRWKARVAHTGVLVAGALLAFALVMALIVVFGGRGGGGEGVPIVEPLPDPKPTSVPQPEPVPETAPAPASVPELQPSPLYVFVRTSTTADGGIMWHFTFSNHGTRPIRQIILAWVALDADGNYLDNPTTNFNLFEKGWNITGSPLAPGTALDEVTVGNLVFTNPAYASTQLMMVAVTFADGAREQLILDESYMDVSNIPTDLGYVTPGL